jgi:(E)-4-hydroxy-3-methylbut-2-enyl-diphosphate synthase
MSLVAPRRRTRELHVGDVKIGADNPIVVQSMATADTRDAKATLRQIAELADAGCEIVRIAVPERPPACPISSPTRRCR